MKKLLLLLMVFMLVGCQRQVEDSEEKYKDGSYHTVVHGYGGDFDMTITIKDDKISDIVVGENNETPSIGGVAIQQLISQMKDKQNENIEVVSGATKTSNGMIDAYKEILSMAKNKAN